MSPRQREPRVPNPPRVDPAHADYVAAVRGLLPGEALTGPWRLRLVARLHDAGWSALQIAVHTRWTTYTVSRLLTRLGREPNTRKGAAA